MTNSRHDLGSMIYTSNFYDPQQWRGQPYRVSRAHPRGRKAQWDTAPFLYPPRELLTAYRGGALDFAALSLEYSKGLDVAYQQSEEFQGWVDALPALGDFTLLCFERGEKPCHRRVAAQWLLAQLPVLGLGELL